MRKKLALGCSCFVHILGDQAKEDTVAQSEYLVAVVEHFDISSEHSGMVEDDEMFFLGHSQPDTVCLQMAVKSHKPQLV